MDRPILWRIFAIVVLALVAQLQLTIIHSTPSSDDPDSYLLTSDNPLFATQSDFGRSLPLINRTVSPTDLSWAVTYLRLPTWSAGYVDCASPSSEVSCYEIHRAAQVVHHWEKLSTANSTIGLVTVHFTTESFPDRLSMLYHGLQIALATNRGLSTNRSSFPGLSLPSSVLDDPDPRNSADLPTDHRFGCCDVSARFPNVAFNGSSWPQVLYTHPVIAPYLRAHFGYHAAHFLGNWLFGILEKPVDCFLGDFVAAEGWMFARAPDILRVSEYYRFLGRCGALGANAAFFWNDPDYRFQENEFAKGEKFDESPESVVCLLRKLTSAKRIVQTFGSRIGFWATAMLGVKGAYLNAMDHVCINLSNSQQGSLWHSFCTPEKTFWYRANSWFYVCGGNVDDARLYIEYLLW
jgi:hypothetical protein